MSILSKVSDKSYIYIVLKLLNVLGIIILRMKKI